MSARRALDEVLEQLPEDRVAELLDYARFLAIRTEAQEWQRLGRQQFARAYGENEPDYTLADIRPPGPGNEVPA